MSEHTSSQPLVGTLLARFGLRASVAEKALPGTVDAARERRREIMEKVTSFLLDHDLEISSTNLIIAHALATGMEPSLARKIEARKAADEPISGDWLRKHSQVVETASERESRTDALLGKLDRGIDQFTETTKSARSATHDYGGELEQHIGTLDAAAKTGALFTEIATLAKTMLERTRQAEEDMRRSESEAANLRRNLKRAQRDAELDHLTGLPNRRAFEALLDRQYREARTAIEPLSVAFCDIDHFKRINDTHGHDTGDRVIQAVAESLSRTAHENCHVARHGGEEFVMIFRNYSTQEACAALDAVRELTAQKRFVNRKTDEPIGSVTFSGGVANIFGYDNPRDALKAADEALYEAKVSGRNRIVIAST